jgi:predicted nucleic acid-binding protein
MSDLVIFDTSVLVDELRTGRHRKRMESVDGLVRTSSVVLAELWRGATRTAERDFLRTLGNNHPILTPTEKNWIESGEILSKIRADRGFAPSKLRDLHYAPMAPASSPRTTLTSRRSITIASFCV